MKLHNQPPAQPLTLRYQKEKKVSNKKDKVFKILKLGIYAVELFINSPLIIPLSPPLKGLFLLKKGLKRHDVTQPPLSLSLVIVLSILCLLLHPTSVAVVETQIDGHHTEIE